VNPLDGKKISIKTPAIKRREVVDDSKKINGNDTDESSG